MVRNERGRQHQRCRDGLYDHDIVTATCSAAARRLTETTHLEATLRHDDGYTPRHYRREERVSDPARPD